MDSDDSSDATATDATATDQRCEHLPNRPIPYRHKTKPPLPNKPRPPLPIKPNVTIPKKPPIAHVKPLTSKRVSRELTSTNQRITLDSSGKGKAPPPPTSPLSSSPSPSSSSSSLSSTSSPPQLPPKDTTPPHPTLKKPTGTDPPRSAASNSSSSTPVTVKKSPFPKNDIQTKILNSVLNNTNLSHMNNTSTSISTTTSTTCIPNDNNNNNNNNNNGNSNINTFDKEKKDEKQLSSKTDIPQVNSRKVITRTISSSLLSSKTVATKLTFSTVKSRSYSSSTVDAERLDTLNNDKNNNNNIIGQKISDNKQNPTHKSSFEHSQLHNLETRRTPPLPPVKPKPRPKPRERPVPVRRLSLLQRQNSTESVGDSGAPSTTDYHSDASSTNELNSIIAQPLSEPPTLESTHSEPTHVNHSVNNESIYKEIDSEDTSLQRFEECVNNILKSQPNVDNLVSSERSRRRAPEVPVRDYKLRSASVDRISVFQTYFKSWQEPEEQVHLPHKIRTNNFPFDLLNTNVSNLTPPKPPARPPRPKHEEIKRSHSRLTASDIQFMHVDFTSSQQAQELGAPILTRQKPETRKTGPPKPQRKNLLRRCRSDAADHRSDSQDVENNRSRSQSQSFQKATDMSTSSPPTTRGGNKMINRPDASSPNISKSSVPPPPRRWYGREQEQRKSPCTKSDDTSSNSEDGGSVTEKITDTGVTDFFHPPKLSCNSPSPVPQNKSKEHSPTPPRVPPRNYNEDDMADKANADSQESLISDQQYNGLLKEIPVKTNKGFVNTSLKTGHPELHIINDISNKSPTFKHDRPLSSISLMSLPSDSGSGSAEMPNTNSILSSGTDSSEEDETEHAKSKRSAKKVYYIAEEIMSSEKVFVRVLCLINVDFRLAVSNATEKAGRPVIPTDVLNRILDFLPQLQNFNEDLLCDLENRLKNW